MHPKPAFFLVFIALFCLPFLARAQKSSTQKSPPKTSIDSMMLESNILVFKQTSISLDSSKATLRVKVLEKGAGGAPIQGTTVLLRRDQDKMLGRVTKHDGRCLFTPTPATYTVRVQMTGLKSLEKGGIKLEGGKVYELEILMARN